MPLVELDLAFVVANQGAPGPVSCDLPPSSRFASATLRWEYWKGSEWRALDLLRDDTLALTRSGHVRLKTPMAGLMVPAQFGEVVPPRTWIRVRVLVAQYERAPRLLAVRTNTVVYCDGVPVPSPTGTAPATVGEPSTVIPPELIEV